MEDTNEIKPQPAVVQMVVQITRKATGAVEEYVLTGTTDTPEQPQESK